MTNLQKALELLNQAAKLIGEATDNQAEIISSAEDAYTYLIDDVIPNVEMAIREIDDLPSPPSGAVRKYGVFARVVK